MKASVVQVGIDVAKADLQVAAGGQNLRFANTPAGHHQLIAWLGTLVLPEIPGPAIVKVPMLAFCA